MVVSVVSHELHLLSAPKIVHLQEDCNRADNELTLFPPWDTFPTLLLTKFLWLFQDQIHSVLLKCFMIPS